LCARVLKSKYYPHGDILKAGPKAGVFLYVAEHRGRLSNVQKRVCVEGW
jgi:hypothetical protein